MSTQQCIHLSACPHWWHHQADHVPVFLLLRCSEPSLSCVQCVAPQPQLLQPRHQRRAQAWRLALLLLLSKLAALLLIGCLPALAVQLTKCRAACCCLGPACASCGQPLVQPRHQRWLQAWGLALLLLPLTRSTLTPIAASTSTRRCSATRCGVVITGARKCL